MAEAVLPWRGNFGPLRSHLTRITHHSLTARALGGFTALRYADFARVSRDQNGFIV